MTDTTKYKPRLKQYLTARGVRQQGDRWACTNHDDENPSAYIYDDERLYCPVCEATYDIFDVAGHITGEKEFTRQLEEVQRALGEIPPDTSHVAGEATKKQHQPPWVRLLSR